MQRLAVVGAGHVAVLAGDAVDRPAVGNIALGDDVHFVPGDLLRRIAGRPGDAQVAIAHAGADVRWGGGWLEGEVDVDVPDVDGDVAAEDRRRALVLHAQFRDPWVRRGATGDGGIVARRR